MQKLITKKMNSLLEDEKNLYLNSNELQLAQKQAILCENKTIYANSLNLSFVNIATLDDKLRRCEHKRDCMMRKFKIAATKIASLDKSLNLVGYELECVRREKLSCKTKLKVVPYGLEQRNLEFRLREDKCIRKHETYNETRKYWHFQKFCVN